MRPGYRFIWAKTFMQLSFTNHFVNPSAVGMRVPCSAGRFDRLVLHNRSSPSGILERVVSGARVKALRVSNRVAERMTDRLQVCMPVVADVLTLLIRIPSQGEFGGLGLVPVSLVFGVYHQAEPASMRHKIFPSVSIDDLLSVRANLPRVGQSQQDVPRTFPFAEGLDAP